MKFFGPTGSSLSRPTAPAALSRRQSLVTWRSAGVWQRQLFWRKPTFEPLFRARNRWDEAPARCTTSTAGRNEDEPQHRERKGKQNLAGSSGQSKSRSDAGRAYSSPDDLFNRIPATNDAVAASSHSMRHSCTA